MFDTATTLHASFLSLQPWPQEEVLLIKPPANPTLLRLLNSPIRKLHTSIAAGISRLDQLRDAFRRRHASSPSSMPPSAQARAKERGRSPGWLSRMHRNSSPSKRSASPSKTRESSPRVQTRRYPLQADGNVSSGADTPETEPAQEEGPPPMPDFLKLTHDGKIVFAPKSLDLEPDVKCKKYLTSSWSLFVLRRSA